MVRPLEVTTDGGGLLTDGGGLLDCSTVSSSPGCASTSSSSTLVADGSWKVFLRCLRFRLYSRPPGPSTMYDLGVPASFITLP